MRPLILAPLLAALAVGCADGSQPAPEIAGPAAGPIDAALYDDRLLSDETRALAFADQTGVPVDEDNVDAYGYGWHLDGERMWHSGETMGFRNAIIRDPSQRMTVLVLTNRNAPRPYPLARRIMDEIH